jgi:hypothetical protein
MGALRVCLNGVGGLIFEKSRALIRLTAMQGVACVSRSDADSKPVKIGSPIFASAGLPRGNIEVTCFIACMSLRFHAESHMPDPTRWNQLAFYVVQEGRSTIRAHHCAFGDC